MKHLKLFESFSINEIEENNKMANDIVEDIKTISYILEEEGFDIEYLFNAKSRNFATDLSFRVDEYNKLISSPNISGCKPVNIDMVVVKIIGRTITDPKTFQRTLTDSGKEAIERYINLLKEHLDYIDPNNITTQRSLIGHTNVIIKLFS
jgi:hypothetical protein